MLCSSGERLCLPTLGSKADPGKPGRPLSWAWLSRGRGDLEAMGHRDSVHLARAGWLPPRLLIADSRLLSLSDHFSDPDLPSASPRLSISACPRMGFPRSSVGKEFAYNVGDPDLIPGLGRSPREGSGNPLHYSCLENQSPRQRSLGLTRARHDLPTKPPPPFVQELLFQSFLSLAYKQKIWVMRVVTDKIIEAKAKFH